MNCEVGQSCPTLCDPMDCSPPGSSVHGIFQARDWSGLPFPSPGHLPNPGIEPGSPALQADVLLSELPGKPINKHKCTQIWEHFLYTQGGTVWTERWSISVNYPLIFTESFSWKDLLYSTGNSAQCHVAAGMGTEFGDNGDMDMYGWVPLVLTWNYHTIANQLYPNTK